MSEDNYELDPDVIEAFKRGFLPQEEAQLIQSAINRGQISNPKLARESTHFPERRPPSIPESLKEDAGQVIGGIGLPLAAGFSASPPGLVGMMGLAALGGAGGKGWQNLIESGVIDTLGFSEDSKRMALGAAASLATGDYEIAKKATNPGAIYNTLFDPEVLDNTLDVVGGLSDAAKEEAAGELMGQAVAKVAGGLYHTVRPKIDEGISELQKVMVKYGGGFTKAEQTGRWTTQMVDSIVRGSAAGKRHMLNADKLNAEALKQWQSDITSSMVNGVKTLDHEEFGLLIKSTLGDSEKMFQEYIRPMYESFDDLVKSKFVRKTEKRAVQSKILDTNGDPITSEVIEKYAAEMKPVDLRALKREVAKVDIDLKEVANLGRSEWGGDIISKMLNLDDAVSFSTAQRARSYILSLQRAATRENDPTGKLRSTLGKAADKLTKAMDNAAKEAGPEAFQKYQKIKTEANEGYSAFRATLLNELIVDKTAATALGEKLFRDGNIGQIRELRKALAIGQKYTGIPAENTWDHVKAKYIESMIRNSAKERAIFSPEETVEEFAARAVGMDAVKLAQHFNPADPKNSVFVEMFSAEERKNLGQLAKALGVNQTRSAAGLSMLVQIMQGGLVTKGVHEALQGKFLQAGTKLVGAFLPTDTMARMMVNPKWNRVLLSAAKTPKTAKNAPIVALKLYKAIEEAQKEAAGEEGSFDRGVKSATQLSIDVGKEGYNFGKGALKSFMEYPGNP